MGAVYAAILMGTKASNDDGINPSYILMLQEGDTPSWNISEIPSFSSGIL
jgi:hypothetical protein